jgi:hypothetical protein
VVASIEKRVGKKATGEWSPEGREPVRRLWMGEIVDGKEIVDWRETCYGG